MAKVFRACTTRKIGIAAAAILASISVLMVVNGANFLSRRPGAYDELEREASLAAEFPRPSTSRGSKGSRGYQESEAFVSTVKVKPMKTNHNLIEEKQNTAGNRAKWRDPVVVVDISNAPSHSRPPAKRKAAARDGAGRGAKISRPRVETASPSPAFPPPPPPPFVPYEPDLPSDHMCSKFAYPPPAVNRRKSGFRPCAVCYLPLESSIAAMPPLRNDPLEVVRELSYVSMDDEAEKAVIRGGGTPKFGGHPTLEDRKASFDIKEKMHLHCGFVPGSRPGNGTGFDYSEEDRNDMESCHGVVVASAIFGSYDVMNQPSHISERSKREVCFFMFLDAQTYDDFVADGTLPSLNTQKVGLWRVVRVTNIPYTDPRRTGKIPKLLLHRLFPNARFSLWVDGKLELVVDPYRVLERFLWRHNHTWAISRHYKRFDVFVEADANKAAAKYDNKSIDEQMDAYRNDGMVPYTEAKLPITSDVPEGCMIIREHTPITNLMGCLWFNEVERFTSRDQLSFGYVRDKLIQKAQFRQSMFQDCERRNFVVQKYHKELLLARSERKIVFQKEVLDEPNKDKLAATAANLLGVPILSGNRRILEDKMVEERIGTQGEENSERRPRKSGESARRRGFSDEERGGSSMGYLRDGSEEKDARRKGT